MGKNKQNWKKIEEQFSKEQGLPFTEIIKNEEIEKALDEENVKYRERTLTPIITLWAFLTQVLNGESGRKAVERILAFLVCQKMKIFSLTESAYCQAKKRLPENFLKNLACRVGKDLSNQVAREQLWCQRRVKVEDGSCLLMADTEDNQQQYPQYYNSKKGCGYPIARIAVLFCLATGVVLEKYLAPKEVSERTLFRRFYESLEPGDVLLGDRGCGSFADIAILKNLRIDCVFRIYHRKKVDFSTGIKLSKKDHIVQWNKPNRPQTSAWSKEEYKSFPKEIWVREVEFVVDIPGFRTKKIAVVTTLLDHKTYSKEALALLYERRWESEINLRHLKTTLNMEFINANTPSMVHNNVWVRLLAYNLIRRVMFSCAQLYDVDPLRISFKGTLDRIDVFLPQIAIAQVEVKVLLFQILLYNISQDILPVRRGERRIYARCIKPRKNFSRINRSREEYRQHILKQSVTP